MDVKTTFMQGESALAEVEKAGDGALNLKTTSYLKIKHCLPPVPLSLRFVSLAEKWFPETPLKVLKPGKPN